MKKKLFILPWLSLGCMVYGIWLCFCEIFECSVYGGNYLVPAFIIAAVTTFLFLQWNRKITFGLAVVGLLAVFWYVMRHAAKLHTEAQGIVYYVNKRSQEYYNTIFFEGHYQSCLMDHTLLWVILGILFAAFMALFLFRLGISTYGFLPCYLVIGAGLFFGKLPEIRGTLFLFVGILLAMFWMNRQERGGRMSFRILRVQRRGHDWQRNLYFFLCMAVVLVLAGQFMELTKDKLFSHADRVQKKQLELEKKITQMATEASKYIQGKMTIDSNGKLSNDEPEYAERPVMEVTLGEPPETDIYLKGFVGIHYQNGQWEQENGADFQRAFPEEESREQLASLGYQTIDGSIASDGSNLDDYFDFYMDDTVHCSQIKIHYVGQGKLSSFTYLPYFSDITTVIDEDNEEYLGIPELFQKDTFRTKLCTGYMIYYIPMGLYDCKKYYNNFYSAKSIVLKHMMEYSKIPEKWANCYGDFSSMQGSPLRGDTKELKDYLKYLPYIIEEGDIETIQKYMGYAWKEYGYQGESDFFDRKEFQHKLKKFNSNYEKTNQTSQMSTMDRVDFVQKILKEEAVYSKQLERLPVNEDYAKFFLLNQKKGFCEHFATAGTLLMRELGIPSRYVGGYRIPVKRFEKNEDGTYTAKVLDSDAHAWTEVLAGCLGWFPAEMTPAAQSRERKKQKKVSATQKVKTTATPKRKNKKEMVTPVTKPTSSIQPSATPLKKKKQAVLKKTDVPKEVIVLAKVATVMIGVSMVFALYLLSNRIYYASRKRKLLHVRERDRNLYVRLRLHDLLSRLRACGVAVSAAMPEDQWFPVIEVLCGQKISQGDWEDFMRIVQKAAFSNQEITREEYDAFCKMCKMVEDAAWEKVGKVRRLYLKYTGRMGR